MPADRSVRALHTVVIWAASAFGWDPGDDLIRIGYVAGFAMYTIRWIQADALAIRLRRVVDHFVYVRRTEILTWAAKFFHAAGVADIGVVDDQMRGLIFFMLCAGVIEVGQFVER